MSRLGNYIRHVALVTDDEINVIFGGKPPFAPQGTISLRAAIAARYGSGYKRWLGRLMCAFLGHFQPHHCEQVLEESVRQRR